MTVEQITLPAIRVTYPDGGTRHLVPLFDPTDGSWWSLDEEGAAVWRSAADIVRFVDELAAELDGPPSPQEAADMAGYRALARLLAELEQQRQQGVGR